MVSLLRKNILGLQHLIAMFGATTLVPLLTGLDVSVTLFAAGVGTLIFHFLTERKVPVFLGSSFAFIPGIIAIGATSGLQYAQGGIVVAGILYLLFSFLVYKIGIKTINKYLPKYVVGAIITIIGLMLIPVAIDMSMTKISIAATVFLFSIFIMFFTNGFSRQLVILLTIIFGYGISLLVGEIAFEGVREASWLTIPNFTFPKFNFYAISILAPVVLATFMEHIGDITANGQVVGKNFIKDPGLHKTLLGDGIATAFAGMIGGPANTTYSENTGVLAVTENYNPEILRIAAVFAIILSFIEKIAAVLNTIPVFVLGGVSLLLFGMIAKIGLDTIYIDKSWKNLPKVITVLIMWIIAFGNLNFWVFSSLSLAAIAGILLNFIFVHIGLVK